MTKTDIFESFNARYLSYEDIAKTFITNSQYDQLLTNGHALLLGPRGSGKTTLLKMLTPLCQFYIKFHKPEIYKNLGFVAVYIPTDIQWQRQIEIFYKETIFPEKVKDNFPRFLVTTNILLCLVDTFKQLLEIYSRESKDTEDALVKEVELAKKLIYNWDIERPILPALESIKQALYKRLKDGNNLLKMIRYEQERFVDNLPHYYYDDYFDLAVLGCSAFEETLEKYSKTKWALCFDELEISPEWLQQELLQRFRSTDQRFLFKLTTSPIVSIVNKITNEVYKIDAREDEDYRVVRTWNHNVTGQKEWNKFAEKLVKQKIERLLGDGFPPQDIFGNDLVERNLKNVFSVFKFSNKKQDSHYNQNGYYWSLFKALANSDESFMHFLEKKNINPHNPLPNSPEQLDQVFRKILQIVMFRYHFLKKGNKIRSRKNPALYFGLPTIYELCDGNPRFLIGLTDALLLHVKNKERNSKFSITEQSIIISDFSRKYLDLIASHPDSNKEISPGRYINLAILLKEIGSFFQNVMLRDNFKMDVYSTFIVDFDVHEKVADLIELGVHLGAVIYLDPKKVVSEEGLRGKKLRLSYLLHPFFNLPIRDYSPVKLSSILNRNKGKQIPEQLTFNL